MIKRIVLACAAATALLAFGAGSAGATVPTASVTGGGAGFPAVFGGDRVQVELAARLLEDGSTVGRFNIVHHSASGGLVAHFVGDVTCLSVTGDLAKATGVITGGSTPGFGGFDPTGMQVAMTVRDLGATDVVGFDASFIGQPHFIAPCSFAPPFFVVEEGNLTVQD